MGERGFPGDRVLWMQAGQLIRQLPELHCESKDLPPHHFMSFIWQAYQQSQIAEVKTDAIEAKQEAAQYSDRVRALETQVSHMALACQAMWELLRERTGISESELLAKMKEVDLRDGAQDGRMTPVLIKCPACGKPANSKSASCMYCGAAIPKPHVFQ
jgi:hypothetical protein